MRAIDFPESNKTFEKIKASEKVVVMHPTCAERLKDKISYSLNPVNFEYEYRIEGQHRLFISTYLPRDHFAVMELGQYEEYKKKGEL